MKIFWSVVFISIGCVFAGCAYNVPATVSPAVNVYSSYEDKIPGSFVLVIDDNLMNIHREIKPSSYVCSAHKFPVALDSALALSVRQTSEAIFEQIIERRTMPSKSELEQLNCYGTLYIKLSRFYPQLRFSQGFWSTTAIASCDLVLEVIAKDKNNQRLLYTTVGGNRTVDGDGGGACAGGAEVLSEALFQTMREAMERYAERISNCQKIRSCTSF